MKSNSLANTIIAAVFALAGSVPAQTDDSRSTSIPVKSTIDGKEAACGRLVGNTEVVVAGKPFLTGLLVRLQPGWRVFSTHPGEAGFPLSLEWELPKGFAASHLCWPKDKLVSDGNVHWNVYDEEVLAICEITPPKVLQGKETVIKAHVQWACENGSVCLTPIDTELTLSLTVGESEKPANVPLFEKHKLEVQ
jgi:DsbC/DsbD-like thiol-disulfide interchange protein